MTSRASTQLRISAQQGSQALTAQQKKFNSLVARIARQQELLAAWGEATPLFQQRHAQELAPLLDSYRALNAEFAHFLDAAVSRKAMSKVDRQTLSELVCELAAGLMDGEHRDAMKALYNKYSESDADAEEQEARDAVKSMVRESFGVDLGEDVDMDSPEAVLRRVQEQMEARQAHVDQARAHHQAGRATKPGARERRLQEEAQQASQSVREVYRKLASALHPDREPDTQERQRKTALMQRVNQAYAAGNLLGLLRLQLEVEQIDPTHIDGLSETRLKHYNKVLAEQLSELQQEVFGTEQAFKLQFGLHPGDRITPGSLTPRLRGWLQQLQMDIHQFKRQRRMLEDPAHLKAWLKQERRRMAVAPRAMDDLPDDLLDLLR